MDSVLTALGSVHEEKYYVTVRVYMQHGTTGYHLEHVISLPIQIQSDPLAFAEWLVEGRHGVRLVDDAGIVHFYPWNVINGLKYFNGPTPNGAASG